MNYQEFEQVFELKFNNEWDYYYSLNKERLNLKNKRIATQKLATIISAVFQISRKQSFHGMTLRDLSLVTDISMGGLYKYFKTKDDLIIMIHDALVKMTAHCLETISEENPIDALSLLLKYHLFISERLKKWFYFVFMEAKHLDKPLLEEFVRTERLMEEALIMHIKAAQKAKICHCESSFFAAATLKAMLQEWYLKSYKYATEAISVDQYNDLLKQTMFRLLQVDYEPQVDNGPQVQYKGES